MKAVKRTKEYKALGEDGLLLLVGKHLWLYLGDKMSHLFTVSLEKGYYLKPPKQTMIITKRLPH